jgi:hypothetical protein
LAVDRFLVARLALGFALVAMLTSSGTLWENQGDVCLSWVAV